MNNFDLFIKPIIDKLDALQQQGYSIHIKSTHDNGRDTIYRWERKTNWRKDAVQLVFFTDRPDSLQLGLQVSLIIDGRGIIFSAVSVSDLMHKANEFQFPKMLKELRAKQTIDSISNDLFESLKWIDRFKEKKSCLQLIRDAKPEDNITIRPNGKLYSAVEKLLTDA